MYEALQKIAFSEQTYISCQKALNIQDRVNGTGDWHTKIAWNPKGKLGSKHVLGKGMKFNTNAYLGSLGVFEASEVLQSMGVPHFADTVYAANHERAIADMVILEALSNPQPKWSSVVESDLDGWMPGQKDKQKVYALLHRAIHKMSQNSAEYKYVNFWIKQMKNADIDF